MVLTLILGLIALPGFAQDRSDCFCLENPGTRMIERYGCEARVIASRGIERVSCQGADFIGRETIEEVDRFTRIPDGEGQCLPCYASQAGETGDVIRGGGAEATQ